MMDIQTDDAYVVFDDKAIKVIEKYNQSINGHDRNHERW